MRRWLMIFGVLLLTAACGSTASTGGGSSPTPMMEHSPTPMMEHSPSPSP